MHLFYLVILVFIDAHVNAIIAKHVLDEILLWLK